MFVEQNELHGEHNISDHPWGALVINTVDRLLFGTEKMIKTL